MSDTDKVNILLVDDQPARLLTYEAILGDLGENLVTAQSGREALQLLMEGSSRPSSSTSACRGWTASRRRR